MKKKDGDISLIRSNYKKIIYLLTALVLVGNTLLAPALNIQEVNRAKAETELEIPSFYVEFTGREKARPQLTFRWKSPDLTQYWKDNPDPLGTQELKWVLNVTRISDKDHFINSQVAGTSSNKLLAYTTYNKAVDWNNDYTATLDLRDNTGKTLAGKTINFKTKLDQANGEGKNGKCPPENARGWWQSDAGKKPVYHVEWYEPKPVYKFAKLNEDQCKSFRNFNADPTGLIKSGELNGRYEYTNSSVKAGDIIKITTKEAGGSVSVTVQELGKSSVAGDFDSEDEKTMFGGSETGKPLATNTKSDDDRCKMSTWDKLTGLFNVGKYIAYAMCFVGDLFIKAGTFIIDMALGTLLKASQISDLRFSPEFIPSAHAQNPPPSNPAETLAEAVRSQPVKNVWFFCLSFVDVVIIVSIIIVAFSQILNLQIDSYTVKKALPGLILGIIGANLSYFIILGLLDLSQVISVEILNRAGGKEALANNLARLMGFSNPGDVATDGAIAAALFALITSNVFFIFVAIILGLILFMIPAVLILLLALLMYWRIYMILILTAVAPLAFVSLGIPQATQYFKIWWKNLFNWIAIGPVILFTLALAASFEGTGLINTAVTTPGTAPPTDLSQFGGWVIGLILLSAAFTIPLKMLGGPVGQAIAGFATANAKKAGKFGMQAASNKLNKSNHLRGENLKQVQKDLARHNELTNLKKSKGLTPEEQAELDKLGPEWKLRYKNNSLLAGTAIQSGVNYVPDYMAGQQAQADYYGKKRASARLTSNAFGKGAGEMIAARELAIAKKKENADMDYWTYKGMAMSDENKEIRMKALDHSIKEAGITSASFTDPTEQALFDSFKATLDSGDHDATMNSLTTLEDNLTTLEGRKNVQDMKSWAEMHTMGSPDKLGAAAKALDVKPADLADYWQTNANMLVARNRVGKGKGSKFSIMAETLSAPYTTEGSAGAPHEDIMPELDLDDASKMEMVANLKITPTLDDGALEAMGNKIRQKITNLRMKSGVTNPVSDQEINRARIQIKQFHEEFHKQQDKALDERVGEQYDGVMEGMKAKINTGVEFDPTSLHEQTQKALQSIDREIQGGSTKLAGNPLNQVQDIMSKVSLSTDVSKSNIAGLAQIDAKEVRAQLAKYEKVLSGLVGKTNITSADIQLTPKAQSEIKLEMKTEDVKSELGKLEGKLGDQLKTAIHGAASSTAPLDQEWIKPIQASLAQAARAQGLQLGEQNMEAATRELLTVIDQHMAQGGQPTQIDTGQLQKSITESLGRHSSQTVQVQGTYGEGI